ncbi:MAG: hypothetical protein LC737_06100 [Chloroflexi bacterium]|nr:hypothetical protein [Chloroflexota bacterium]
MGLRANPFVRYRLHADALLPPFDGGLYEYVFAANGVFVRAERPELCALIPIAACELRGLRCLEPCVELRYPRVSQRLVTAMLQIARAAVDAQGLPREVLFHLIWQAGWRLQLPGQCGLEQFVVPLGPALGSSHERALVEVHSHQAMPLSFSAMDDADETAFRIYAVLANVFQRPTLHTRVGIYGHHRLIRASNIFELPSEVRCGLEDAHDV